MRKAIILLAFAACLTSLNAQTVSFGVPLGFSSNAVPTIGTNLQVNINHLVIAAGFDAQMSRKVVNGDLYWTRIGASLFLPNMNSLEITAGVASYRRSSDIKSLNDGLGLVSVYYVHPIDPKYYGALFAGITTTNQFSFASAGIRFIFRKRQKDGCPSTWVR
jgi:hypothetical protein